MNDRARNAVIAVLAVVAVSLAAATLSSTIAPSERASGSGPGVGSGEGGTLPVPGGAPPPADPIELPTIPYSSELLVALFALGALIAGYYLLRNREAWRALALVLAVVVIAALGALWLASSGEVTPPNASAPNGSSLGGGGGGQSSTTESVPTPLSSVWLLVLGGLALAVVALWLLRARSGATTVVPEENAD